ncbi:carbohydrate ABC transporter permease [Paenibacillus doosanensis]|uniref:L-arabinose transport system permease protein AraQ n=1 Tax=Paenibacillus konkukensis TaxID=2020716 RepID=A0ABY4RG62_9BACL|nr:MULTISPECIES: carbohydrate ABC transporter permease [Paenibacillus]MCS7463819.1 carbohydrate ABC transporter permease [Paenibacillus doosanensis]UQZ81372.1 L-arabinose transport system permease protein AraQ [Paenibacillus konkukensis]
MALRLQQTVKYLILSLFTFLSIYPVFLMITSSFKTKQEITTHPLGLPSSFSLDNYKEVWEKVHFSEYFVNSLYITAISVILVLLVSSMAAFYVARYSFRWNGMVLFFFMLGLMLPMKLAISPLYMMMLKLGLLDTHLALMIVYVAGHISFAVFVFYGFFRTLPKDLDQSARIDGCNDFQVYYKIVLPLMRPALATVSIVDSIGIWNDFFYPLIFIKSTELGTIPLGMLTLFGEYDTDWNLLFCGLTLSSLPLIIAFLFASRQFIEGMTTGAVK